MKSKILITITLFLLAIPLTAASPPPEPDCGWGRPNYPACLGHLTKTRMVRQVWGGLACFCNYRCDEAFPATTCSKSGTLRGPSVYGYRCVCKNRAWCHKLVN